MEEGPVLSSDMERETVPGSECVHSRCIRAYCLGQRLSDLAFEEQRATYNHTLISTHLSWDSEQSLNTPHLASGLLLHPPPIIIASSHPLTCSAPSPTQDKMRCGDIGAPSLKGLDYY